MEPLVGLADLVLFDLKTTDEEQHRRYTGVPLDQVLKNAQGVTATGKPIWIRTPIIPGYTDGEENIRRIARLVRALPTVQRYDLLAFNNTCVGKYRRLGRSFPLSNEELVSEEKMNRLADVAASEGLGFVHWSGMTRRPAATPVIDSIG